jgi:hypothetical protein
MSNQQMSNQQKLTAEEYSQICNEVAQSKSDLIEKVRSGQITKEDAKIELTDALQLRLRHLFNVEIDSLQHAKFSKNAPLAKISALLSGIQNIMKNRQVAYFDSVAIASEDLFRLLK